MEMWSWSIGRETFPPPPVDTKCINYFRFWQVSHLESQRYICSRVMEIEGRKEGSSEAAQERRQTSGGRKARGQGWFTLGPIYLKTRGASKAKRGNEKADGRSPKNGGPTAYATTIRTGMSGVLQWRKRGGLTENRLNSRTHEDCCAGQSTGETGGKLAEEREKFGREERNEGQRIK
jgi:hypothetical protein